MQHKEIVKRLTEVTDAKSKDQSFFSVGHINGAFVTLKKNMSNLSITKFKKDGGVYYQYISNSDHSVNTVGDLDHSTLDELKNSLKECFKVAHTLKSEILSGEFEQSDELLELLGKINDLEISVLKLNSSKSK